MQVYSVRQPAPALFAEREGVYRRSRCGRSGILGSVHESSGAISVVQATAAIHDWWECKRKDTTTMGTYVG